VSTFQSYVLTAFIVGYACGVAHDALVAVSRRLCPWIYLFRTLALSGNKSASQKISRIYVKKLQLICLFQKKDYLWGQFLNSATIYNNYERFFLI
jgi:hypothetical protein